MSERNGSDAVSARNIFAKIGMVCVTRLLAFLFGPLLALSLPLLGPIPLSVAAPEGTPGPAAPETTEGPGHHVEAQEPHRPQKYLTLDPKTGKLKRESVEEAEEAEEGQEPLPPSPQRPARASTPSVSFGGGTYVIKENEHHRGDFVLLGGSVDVRGEVTGSLVLIGAQGTVSGEVKKDVVGIGSKIKVLDGTVIRGSLVNVCGSVEKAPEAEVGKDFVDLALLDFSRFVRGGSILSFLLWFVFWIKILKAAFLSLAVVALAAIFTDRIALCAGVLPGALGRSFLFGLLCWVGAVFSIIVMAITLIGIPFAILAVLVFKLVWGGGIAAVSCAAGQQIGRNVFGRSLSYFSATLLGYLLFVIVYLIPFFGGLVMGILGLIGLGLMAITRLGTRIPGSGPPLFPGVPPPPAAPAAAGTAPLA